MARGAIIGIRRDVAAAFGVARKTSLVAARGRLESALFEPEIISVRSRWRRHKLLAGIGFRLIKMVTGGTVRSNLRARMCGGGGLVTCHAVLP